METSCLMHPPKDPLVIIRKWQLEFFNNNPCDAALCSFFEYWHNIKIDMAKKASQLNDIAEMHGDARTQDESLIQYHTAAQLRSGIMNLYSERTIRVSLKRLEKKGVISIMKNPNPKFAFDKTKHFLFHPDVFDKFLQDYTIKRLKELKNLKNSKTPADEHKLPHRCGKTSTRCGKTSDGDTPHEPTPAVTSTHIKNGPEITTETTSITNINTTYCLSDESSNTAKTSDDNTSKTRGPEAGESVRPNSKSGCDNNIEDCNRNLSKKNKETVEWADKRCVFADFAMPDLLKEYRVQIANGGDKRKLNAIILVALEKLGVTTMSADGKPLWAVASKLRGVGDDKTIAILSAMYQKAQEGKLTNPNGYMHAAIRASPKQVVKEGKVPKITSEELEKRREEMGWA